MQKKRYFHIGTALVIATLATTLRPAHAETEKITAGSKQRSVNEVIGHKVQNTQNEDLGKISDVIIDLDSNRVPYAIISHEGIFGTERNKTVVPLSSLRYSPEKRSFTLNATKEQVRTASRTPTSAWSSVSDSSWAKSVDGFYGDPASVTVYRAETGEGRQLVRDPIPKGAELLMQPTDEVLTERVSQSLDTVRVTVENGLTKIYGTVESEAERDRIESRIKMLEGVNRVESHLRVRNQ
jgi:sporulation protein YlmC with PRC-barrel domain